MQSYQVVATGKAWAHNGAYRYITSVRLHPGGYIFPKEFAAEQIEKGEWSLFTSDIWGNKTPVLARHLRNGHPFLITEADKSVINNLLSLPDILT